MPLPEIDASLREIAHALDDRNADGFALLTHVQGVYLGDARLDPVMEELNRREAVVFVHPTSPAGCAHVDMGRPAPLVEYLFDTKRAVINLVLTATLSRYPAIR
ncbi:amidohydrolase family protein [Kocuria sp. ZOR0020]|uniref:amidohydrolase family protein n=1 Tax=Kocuria sp. ZOR0020 TaxID=1339234 RepID=UPI00068D7470|nr:amidohydrolase family protein [Kocuria sp. ZOR0020]